MLRLRDARSGQRSVLDPRAHRVQILVVPDDTGPAGTLRRAVLGDLVRRAVEMRGGQVELTSSVPVPDLLAYNVHPPAATGSDRRPDVVVGRQSPPAIGLLVGPAEVDDAGEQGAALAVRLALLGHRYSAPARIRADDLAAQRARLLRWRSLVARWAESPSRPAPAAHLQSLAAGVDDDLDTPALLALMDDVAADGGVPDGGRFEFFLYADRLLGLDLGAALHS